MIANCKVIVEKIYENIRQEIADLKQKKIIPHLVIIKANNNVSSEKYVNNKIKKGQELGIRVSKFDEFKQNSKNDNEIEKLILSKINELNKNDSVHGIIVQLPLFENVNSGKIIESISPYKDIDGFSNLFVSRLWNNNNEFYISPCTAKGIMEIFNFYKYDLKGKNVVIINRSNIVGKPLAALMLKKDATVTICHSKTVNLNYFTQNADVIVTATGRVNFLTKEMVAPKSFIIDVAVNLNDNNKICGDADFKNLENYVKMITPVPNGVGILTVAMVFQNLIELIKRKMK